MWHLRAAGGLAVAACACWPLFSGAASARHAAGNTVSVSGIANGTTIQFHVTSSGVKGISFSGSSNLQFTSISSAGGSCNLTPTNFGGFCSFGTPVTSFVVDTNYSGQTPTVVTGQVIYADNTTGTFSASVSQGTGECDWVVGFTRAPRHAHSLPLDYKVVVTNAGTAGCDPADLSMSADLTAGGKPIEEVVLNHHKAAIPGLQPQESHTAAFDVEKIPLDYDSWQKVVFGSPGHIELTAKMPLDADGPATDEQDSATTLLLPEVVEISYGGDEIDATCPPSKIPHDPFLSCTFEPFVVLFRTPPSSARRTAAMRRPLIIGTAHGVIKGGKKGPLHIKLNKTGRKLLRKNHKLPVTLTGIRKQGKVETLVKGRLTIH